MGNCTSAPAGKVKNIGLFYCNRKDTGKYKIVVTYENGKKKNQRTCTRARFKLNTVMRWMMLLKQ